MRPTIITMLFLLFLTGCEERTEKAENSRGIPGPEKVEALAPDLDEQERELKEQGFETRRREKGDSTFLMQRYYMVFLKSSGDGNGETPELARLEEEHSNYLDQLVEEGHASFGGPLDDEGRIKEVIIFKTTTEEAADSLARMDPLVEAGLVQVEVHPWWVEKGGTMD